VDRICVRVIALALLTLILSTTVWGAEKKKVNILSWWGYLSADSIKSVEMSCNVDLYVDEYYSSSEFLRRWVENPKMHDLIIFSNTIFNAVKGRLNKDKIPNIINTSYHPLVSDKVKNLGFGANTRLLTLAFTGFMWNKKNINMHKGLSLDNMLIQANDKIVVILDDAIEGLQILDSLKFFQTAQGKEKLNAKVVIANDIESLVKQNNFGFAYHWHGGSIDAINKTTGDFGFMVHPNLSHVTADLLSILKSSPEARCVFNQVAGYDFLKKLQSKTFYFSPYGGVSDDDNKLLISLYNNYFLNLKKYRWLKQAEIQDFKAIDDKWKKLKIQLSN
jgi:spermidine/putrescine-binding protein